MDSPMISEPVVPMMLTPNRMPEAEDVGGPVLNGLALQVDQAEANFQVDQAEDAAAAEADDVGGPVRSSRINF